MSAEMLFVLSQSHLESLSSTSHTERGQERWTDHIKDWRQMGEICSKELDVNYLFWLTRLKRLQCAECSWQICSVR